MGINKETIQEISALSQKMVNGRKNGTITTTTYSTKFKPYLTKFKNKYGYSPNVYLQNDLKKFYESKLEGLSSKLTYKSFGYWGRSIYNYSWACIYYDFDKDAIPASYSPQLFILVNKEGIKFGFCYGHYINDDDELVKKAISENNISLLYNCIKGDKDLCLFNSTKDEVTARPEKLMGKNDRITINSKNDIVNNWSSSSLLIREFYNDHIPENIDEIIQNTLNNLKEFFLNLLPIDVSNGIEFKPKIVNNTLFDINTIIKSLNLSGLQFNNRLITRFTISLLSKPFLILTGLSGSGKTKLAQAFAMWICETDDQYCIIPVGADWTNREPLLGFPNALNPKQYMKPDYKVLDLIISANKNENKPYFLILDEMNLSHVERYFADYLSVMETNKRISLHSCEENENGIPMSIELPKNLFIVGTVNIDETTYMFSPKVLDRANVIEFRVTAKEMEDYFQNSSKLELNNLRSEGAGMAEAFVEIAKDTTLVPKKKTKSDLEAELINFFKELKKTGAEFGYRTAGEINRFAAIANIIEPVWKSEDIIDAAIMQKLLPKVHGSRKKLEPVLRKLCELCLIDSKDFDETIKSDDENIYSTRGKYPISLEKICRMYKNLMHNGFTSYAEA